jgi:hypothetical protein
VRSRCAVSGPCVSGAAQSNSSNRAIALEIGRYAIRTKSAISSRAEEIDQGCGLKKLTKARSGAGKVAAAQNVERFAANEVRVIENIDLVPTKPNTAQGPAVKMLVHLLFSELIYLNFK